MAEGKSRGKNGRCFFGYIVKVFFWVEFVVEVKVSDRDVHFVWMNHEKVSALGFGVDLVVWL